MASLNIDVGTTEPVDLDIIRHALEAVGFEVAEVTVNGREQARAEGYRAGRHGNRGRGPRVKIQRDDPPPGLFCGNCGRPVRYRFEHMPNQKTWLCLPYQPDPYLRGNDA